MNLIVQKYGGSILNTLDDIEKVGSNIIETLKRGNSVVAVVSALKKETEGLIDYAKSISPNPDPREMDMLISTGEQKTGALLSLYLHGKKIPAISFTGHQIGIITDSEYGNASILKINSEKLQSELNLGKVIIVAGFQGVNLLEEITTLGRGGSDLTAVSIGAALKSDLVEFYKDTGAIFTVNPELTDGKKIKKIDYFTMMELSKGDVSIIAGKAIEAAKKYSVPMIVKGLGKDENTLIVNDDFSFSDERYLAVSVRDDEYQLLVDFAPEAFFRVLGDDISINYLDRISSGDFKKLLLTLSESELEKIRPKLKDQKVPFELSGPFSRIVVVGWGFRTQKRFYSKIMGIIKNSSMDFSDVHFSGFNVSLLIPESDLQELLDIINRENNDQD